MRLLRMTSLAMTCARPLMTPRRHARSLPGTRRQVKVGAARGPRSPRRDVEPPDRLDERVDPRLPTGTLTAWSQSRRLERPSDSPATARTASSSRLRSGTVIPGGRRRPVLELIGCPRRDDLAAVDDHDGVRELIGLVEVLGLKSSVVPRPTSSRMISHIPSRPWGSSPVVGSSRKSTTARDQTRREVEAPLHAAGIRLGRTVSASAMSKRSSSSAPGPGRCFAPCDSGGP